MAHLGADVAAFVDGQLPPDAELAAREHLVECDRCRRAVHEQEHLKRRMVLGPPPGIPASLAASLAMLPQHPPEETASRLRDSRVVRAVVVLAGASMAVLCTAWVVGQPSRAEGDPVAPDVEAHVAEFVAASAAERSPDVEIRTVSDTGGRRLSAARMAELDADGWPCHETLAGDLHRLDGRLAGTDEALALHYGDGRVRLHLIEQTGSLDRGALHGFRDATIAGGRVWVRDGIPTVATWEADGRVYTVVTNAGSARLRLAVEALPTSPAGGLTERIDSGLDRMSAWVAAG